MNAFKNHTDVSTSALTAPLVIRNLISELVAGDKIIRTLLRFIPAHQMIHANLDIDDQGFTNHTPQRLDERASVIALGKAFLAELPPPPASSRDLVLRLRTIAGQTTIKPPAIDMEAADHIEKLQQYIDDSSPIPSINVRRRLPAYMNFAQVTSSPHAIAPDLGDRRFWPVDLGRLDHAAPPLPAVQELVSILEGALADDLVQYHSHEWLARARTAIANHRSPTATPPQQSTPEKRIE